MAIESWMDFPILIMVVIITRSKVDDIVEARQKHRWIQKEQEQKEIDKLKQDQYDLEEEFKEVVTQREEFAKQLNDSVEKQTNLLKVVEQLTEKVSKLETQPFQTQGFMMSSSQNISNPFENLSTSFQVKADIVMYLSDIKSYNCLVAIYIHPVATYNCPVAIYICLVAICIHPVAMTRWNSFTTV